MSFASGMASGLTSIGMGTPNFGATLGRTAAPGQCADDPWLLRGRTGWRPAPKQGPADIGVELAAPPQTYGLDEAHLALAALGAAVARVVSPQPPSAPGADAHEPCPADGVPNARLAAQERHGSAVRAAEGLPVPAAEHDVGDLHPQLADDRDQKGDGEHDEKEMQVHLAGNQRGDDGKLPA